MTQLLNELKISTPGRVCLFGEHQDYLHLPIVAAAISLRISVTGKRRNDRIINIDLPDISSRKSFSLSEPVIYAEERDYFKSSVKVLQRNSFTFSSGFDCVVNGKIPINAGTASSSALVVTWINFLSRMSNQSTILPPEKLARYAYEAEVLEFSEPGGMMDQYSASYGGIISIDFIPETKVIQINPNLKTFVLGNSGEPKNTMFVLSHVKNRILDTVKILKSIDSNFSLNTLKTNELSHYKGHLNEGLFNLLEGTIINHDITTEARVELSKRTPDHRFIGKLLNEHQKILKDVLGISTFKINSMIDAAIDAGAYGAKINGSGGGGCMFAYAPENPEKVKFAIEAEGGKAFIINSDSGSCEDFLENQN
jgi:galactokinase